MKESRIENQAVMNSIKIPREVILWWLSMWLDRWVDKVEVSRDMEKYHLLIWLEVKGSRNQNLRGKWLSKLPISISLFSLLGKLSRLSLIKRLKLPTFPTVTQSWQCFSWTHLGKFALIQRNIKGIDGGMCESSFSLCGLNTKHSELCNEDDEYQK